MTERLVRLDPDDPTVQRILNTLERHDEWIAAADEPVKLVKLHETYINQQRGGLRLALQAAGLSGLIGALAALIDHVHR